MKKEKIDLESTKKHTLGAVPFSYGTSGFGTSDEDCMSEDVYWSIVENGGKVSHVWVCNLGYVLGDVDKEGEYKPNYDYDYNYANYTYTYFDGYYYQYYFYQAPDNNNGGGGGNSGPAVPKPDKSPETRTDCPQSATRNSLNVRNVFDYPVTSINNVTERIADIRDYATTKTDEHALIINYDSPEERYYLTKFSTGTIISGSQTNVGVVPSINTQYYGHTHPEGTVAAPSPRDIIAIFEAIQYQKETDPQNSHNFQFQGSIIFAKDGSEYVVSVDNKQDVDNILGRLDNPEWPGYNDFFITDGNTTSSFKPDSKWEKEYNQLIDKLWNQKQGEYNQEDAQAFALAYLLDKYNMGLKIARRENSNSNFQELKTEYKNSKYILKICP